MIRIYEAYIEDQPKKKRALRNRTVEISENEIAGLKLGIVAENLLEKNKKDLIICGNSFSVLPRLIPKSFDLMFADPPYNLTKDFGKESFRQTTSDGYEEWLDSWLRLCVPLLRPTASVYICGDWRSGAVIQNAASKYFKLRNRITWEREKGRGAKRNWKNATEDIWFFTVSDDYTFNLDAVKQRRRVLAPYKENGRPKDWSDGESGKFRDTHPSNIWTDITVPFWSMPENTDHPTQKPEKLLAKIILASTNSGELILDPFAGSGTTAVTAKKLNRRFIAIESDEQYCLVAAKRLELAKIDKTIQGFKDCVFWERNSGNMTK
ncbi:MAG: site-specific DNA-methyltransferase [Acidobacteria bacterium]|nr:site-specific DNA-methyltransferase [Acidobacteriota bacterium]